MHPDKVAKAASKKEAENLEFRRFLKGHADEAELDQQFLDLHNELFSIYDCDSCRNCCKLATPLLSKEEITSISSLLEMPEVAFIKMYLKPENDYELPTTYAVQGPPCAFLGPDDNCLIDECMPRECRYYPYTDQPERLSSMLAVLENTFVCPVVFEIVERLKKAYYFKRS